MSYDKVIAPGKEGKIRIKIRTSGYGGHKVNKTVRVSTNDPNHSLIQLNVFGEVKNFATIIPRSVYLSGKVGEPLTQTVKIIPETEQPFKILKVTAIGGNDISYSLKEIDLSGKKMYELTVDNTRKTEGRYFETISLITDKSDRSPLSIYVRGNIRPADKEPVNVQNTQNPDTSKPATPEAATQKK